MLNVSQSKLKDFLSCQRRFELRYVDRLTWPTRPADDKSAAAMARGKLFHQQVEQHFLGLPLPRSQSDLLANFLHEGPMPEGKLRVETMLRVPAGEGDEGAVFIGRFDLLAITDDTIHIYDWKTSRPRSAADLRDDWQTRLYLAMVAESGTALSESPISPEKIKMTYWYAQNPHSSQTIAYSQAWHKQNWAEILQITADIATKINDDTAWPLTDDLTQCARCAYAAYCDRQVTAVVDDDVEVETADYDELFEPAKR